MFAGSKGGESWARQRDGGYSHFEAISSQDEKDSFCACLKETAILLAVPPSKRLWHRILLQVSGL